MRGKTLTELLASLKAEVGVNPSSTTNDVRYTQLLNNTQHLLSSEFDFPFLERRFDVTASAGGRYLDLPVTLSLLRPVHAYSYFNGVWMELEYGVGLDEYNAWDSDNGESQDPVLRWAQYGQSGETAQFEIWPMPKTATTIRFLGQKIPETLTGAVTCDLDDLLLVYWCAAEELARLDQKDAEAKMARAKERLHKVRTVVPCSMAPVVFGRGGRPKDKKTLIAIASGIETNSGSVALVVGSAGATVTTGTTMRSTPTSVLLTVRAPVGGDNIFATAVGGSLSTTGFAFTLSGAPSVSGYYLDYVLSA